jgi:transcription elongation factor SPT6
MIRIRDIPERFQIQGDIREIEDDEIVSESQFIMSIIWKEKIERSYSRDLSEGAFSKAVQSVVKFLRQDFFEVPFIHAHRKDYLNGQLDRADLWRIYDLDQVYETLHSKLQKLKQTYRQLLQGSEKTSPIDQDAFLEESFDDSGKRWKFLINHEKISDLYQYMQLNYNERIVALENQRQQGFKKPYRKSPYEEAVKAGLPEFSKVFLISFTLSRCLASIFLFIFKA